MEFRVTKDAQGRGDTQLDAPNRRPTLTGVVKEIRATYLKATFTSDRNPPDVMESDVHLSNIPDAARDAFVPGATFVLLHPDDDEPRGALYVRIPRRDRAPETDGAIPS